MTERLSVTMRMNPEFAEALARGEKWALDYADSSRALDGVSFRRHPERAHHEDGKPRNWCGACAHVNGCIVCDLDEPTGDAYKAMKPHIGKFKD